MIESVVANLEREYGGKVISHLPLRPLPNDIDIYVSEERKDSVIKYLNTESFVCVEGSHKCEARKFIDGKCYFLDIIFNPNYFNKFFPRTYFTEVFSTLVRQDPDVDRFFKYIFLLRADKYAIEFVSKHFDEYRHILFEERYLLNTPFRPSLTKSSLIEMMRGGILMAFFTLTPDACISLFFHSILHRLRRFGRGEVIAFVGPDGSGKSAVIDALAVGLFARKMYMGDWGFALQSMYNKMHNQHIFIARLTYLFFYIENWFRYLKAFFMKMGGHTVLVDRWPGLNRHLRNDNMWLWLNDLIYFFFPRADKYIFISAPPEVIHQRKQELSIEEIGRSQKNLKERLKGTEYKEIENIDFDECLNQSIAYILK